MSIRTHFYHYVKSVRIRSFSSPYFPAFGLNTDRYSLSLHIQSKCRDIGSICSIKIQSIITPITAEAVVRRCSLKKVFLKILWIRRKTSECLRPATLLKQRLWHRCQQYKIDSSGTLLISNKEKLNNHLHNTFLWSHFFT